MANPPGPYPGALCTLHKKKGKKGCKFVQNDEKKIAVLLDFPLNLWYNELSKVERVIRQAVEKNIFQKVLKTP